jgi:hypothetical protein
MLMPNVILFMPSRSRNGNRLESCCCGC